MKKLETESLVRHQIQRVQGKPEVLAVRLFGSAARGEEHSNSDFDIRLVLQPGSYRRPDLTNKRLDYLAAFPIDVQVFQELHLHMRSPILKEGQVLFCRN